MTASGPRVSGPEIGRAVQVPDAPAIPGLTFRRATQADWVPLAEMLNRAHATDGIEEVISPASLAAELAPLDSFRMERDGLVAEIDGAPVGFAFGWRTARGSALTLELRGVIAPEHRRRGIGTALDRVTRSRLAAEAAADPRPGARSFRAFAMEAERSRVALLTAEGFVRIRFGFEMRRSIGGRLPDHPLPPGLELRPVAPDHHLAILEADNEAFRDHWGHRELTAGDVRARFENPDTDTSLWCVAWDGDQVAGVVINAIFRDENAQLGVRHGWLDRVSVRRPWRGRGLAKALCAASLRVLRERGMDEAWLGVDAANPTGAVHLYEELGFAVAHRWFAFGRPLEGPAPAGWLPEGDDPA